jgi:hypothetical protein
MARLVLGGWVIKPVHHLAWTAKHPWVFNKMFTSTTLLTLLTQFTDDIVRDTESGLYEHMDKLWRGGLPARPGEGLTATVNRAARNAVSKEVP